jgi:Domain of unknown function (DUF4335)
MNSFGGMALRYEQSSCRLELKGLPDVSAQPQSPGNSETLLSILTSWELNLGQRASLQGKREHLEALVETVLPYVRLMLSGAAHKQISKTAVVVVAPRGRGHQLQLISSQPNTPPLDLQLDDAELADLTQCLDQMLLDPRQALSFKQPLVKPQKHQAAAPVLLHSWAAPGAAIAAVALCALVAMLLPIPKPLLPASPQPIERQNP